MKEYFITYETKSGAIEGTTVCAINMACAMLSFAINEEYTEIIRIEKTGEDNENF